MGCEISGRHIENRRRIYNSLESSLCTRGLDSDKVYRCLGGTTEVYTCIMCSIDSTIPPLQDFLIGLCVLMLVSHV